MGISYHGNCFVVQDWNNGLSDRTTLLYNSDLTVAKDMSDYSLKEVFIKDNVLISMTYYYPGAPSFDSAFLIYDLELHKALFYNEHYEVLAQPDYRFLGFY